MNLYYVFQGITHKFESVGNYLRSPQKNKTGGKNAGFTNMSNVKKGDVIFHGASGETYAISIENKMLTNLTSPQKIRMHQKKLFGGMKAIELTVNILS